MTDLKEFEKYIDNNISKFKDIEKFLRKINKKYLNVKDKNEDYNNKILDNFYESIKKIINFKSKCCQNENYTDCNCHHLLACEHKNILECSGCGEKWCFYCAERNNYFTICDGDCMNQVCNSCREDKFSIHSYRKITAVEYKKYIDSDGDYDSDDSKNDDYYICGDCKI